MFTRTTLSLILMVVIILVFLAFGTDIFKRGDVYANRASCQQSIDSSITLHLLGQDFGGAIKCPTEYKQFSGSDADIKASVASALYNCWSTWKQGKKELFPLQDEVFCHPCTVFQATSSPRQVSGLIATLKQLQAPNGQTYLAFLQGSQTTEGTTQQVTSVKPDIIDTSQPYAAVFRYAKTTKVTQLQGALIGSALFGVIGGYAGYQLGSNTPADWTAQVLFVPDTQFWLKDVLGCTVYPVNPA
jgi:hypothetical protein